MSEQLAEKILVVDDEPSICEVLCEALTLKGYKVILARNGHEALDMIREGTVSAVITDIRMPKMSGTHCFEEIKRINPGAMVIIASGYSDDGAMRKSLKKGATRFIDKPFNVKQLLRLIREVLDE